MSKKKIGILIIILIVLLLIAGCWYFMNNSRKPGDIFRTTTKGCDSVGYGYKGICYGKLAFEAKDITLCEKMNPAGDDNKQLEFNKSNCKEYYNNVTTGEE